MSQSTNIEVAYALPKRQKIVELQVPEGTTARDAVRLSNIVSFFPDLDIEHAPLGVFGNELGSRGLAAPDQYEVREGDRIEIYRPLIADPKEVRRRRAEEAKQKRALQQADNEPESTNSAD